MIPFSVLDLVPVTEGSTIDQAFANTLDLAGHAEQLGYQRYWLAEHHNMPGIASAATAVLIGYGAGGTSTIRVGASGIMLSASCGPDGRLSRATGGGSHAALRSVDPEGRST